MTLSPTERQRARELADAATPGNWLAVQTNDGWHLKSDARPGYFADFNRTCAGEFPEADAHFVAAARTLVPRLLAALEEAEAEIERLTADREWWRRRVLIGGDGLDQDADAELAEDRADYFASTEDR